MAVGINGLIVYCRKQITVHDKLITLLQRIAATGVTHVGATDLPDNPQLIYDGIIDAVIKAFGNKNDVIRHLHKLLALNNADAINIINNINYFDPLNILLTENPNARISSAQSNFNTLINTIQGNTSPFQHNKENIAAGIATLNPNFIQLKPANANQLLDRYAHAIDSGLNQYQALRYALSDADLNDVPTLQKTLDKFKALQTPQPFDPALQRTLEELNLDRLNLNPILNQTTEQSRFLHFINRERRQGNVTFASALTALDPALFTRLDDNTWFNRYVHALALGLSSRDALVYAVGAFNLADVDNIDQTKRAIREIQTPISNSIISAIPPFNSAQTNYINLIQAETQIGDPAIARELAKLEPTLFTREADGTWRNRYLHALTFEELSHRHALIYAIGDFDLTNLDNIDETIAKIQETQIPDSMINAILPLNKVEKNYFDFIRAEIKAGHQAIARAFANLDPALFKRVHDRTWIDRYIRALTNKSLISYEALVYALSNLDLDAHGGISAIKAVTAGDRTPANAKNNALAAIPLSAGQQYFIDLAKNLAESKIYSFLLANQIDLITYFDTDHPDAEPARKQDINDFIAAIAATLDNDNTIDFNDPAARNFAIKTAINELLERFDDDELHTHPATEQAILNEIWNEILPNLPEQILQKWIKEESDYDDNGDYVEFLRQNAEVLKNNFIKPIHTNVWDVFIEDIFQKLLESKDFDAANPDDREIEKEIQKIIQNLLAPANVIFPENAAEQIGKKLGVHKIELIIWKQQEEKAAAQTTAQGEIGDFTQLLIVQQPIFLRYLKDNNLEEFYESIFSALLKTDNFDVTNKAIRNAKIKSAIEDHLREALQESGNILPTGILDGYDNIPNQVWNHYTPTQHAFLTWVQNEKIRTGVDKNSAFAKFLIENQTIIQAYLAEHANSSDELYSTLNNRLITLPNIDTLDQNTRNQEIKKIVIEQLTNLGLSEADLSDEILNDIWNGLTPIQVYIKAKSSGHDAILELLQNNKAALLNYNTTENFYNNIHKQLVAAPAFKAKDETTLNTKVKEAVINELKLAANALDAAAYANLPTQILQHFSDMQMTHLYLVQAAKNEPQANNIHDFIGFLSNPLLATAIQNQLRDTDQDINWQNLPKTLTQQLLSMKLDGISDDHMVNAVRTILHQLFVPTMSLNDVPLAAAKQVWQHIFSQAQKHHVTFIQELKLAAPQFSVTTPAADGSLSAPAHPGIDTLIAFTTSIAHIQAIQTHLGTHQPPTIDEFAKTLALLPTHNSASMAPILVKFLGIAPNPPFDDNTCKNLGNEAKAYLADKIYKNIIDKLANELTGDTELKAWLNNEAVKKAINSYLIQHPEFTSTIKVNELVDELKTADVEDKFKNALYKLCPKETLDPIIKEHPLPINETLKQKRIYNILQNAKNAGYDSKYLEDALKASTTLDSVTDYLNIAAPLYSRKSDIDTIYRTLLALGLPKNENEAKNVARQHTFAIYADNLAHQIIDHVANEKKREDVAALLKSNLDNIYQNIHNKLTEENIFLSLDDLKQNLSNLFVPNTTKDIRVEALKKLGIQVDKEENLNAINKIHERSQGFDNKAFNANKELAPLLMKALDIPEVHEHTTYWDHYNWEIALPRVLNSISKTRGFEALISYGIIKSKKELGKLFTDEEKTKIIGEAQACSYIATQNPWLIECLRRDKTIWQEFAKKLGASNHIDTEKNYNKFIQELIQKNPNGISSNNLRDALKEKYLISLDDKNLPSDDTNIIIGHIYLNQHFDRRLVAWIKENEVRANLAAKQLAIYPPKVAMAILEQYSQLLQNPLTGQAATGQNYRSILETALPIDMADQSIAAVLGQLTYQPVLIAYNQAHNTTPLSLFPSGSVTLTHDHSNKKDSLSNEKAIGLAKAAKETFALHRLVTEQLDNKEANIIITDFIKINNSKLVHFDKFQKQLPNKLKEIHTALMEEAIIAKNQGKLYGEDTATVKEISMRKQVVLNRHNKLLGIIKDLEGLKQDWEACVKELSDPTLNKIQDKKVKDKARLYCDALESKCTTIEQQCQELDKTLLHLNQTLITINEQLHIAQKNADNHYPGNYGTPHVTTSFHYHSSDDRLSEIRAWIERYALRGDSYSPHYGPLAGAHIGRSYMAAKKESGHVNLYAYPFENLNGTTEYLVLSVDSNKAVEIVVWPTNKAVQAEAARQWASIVMKVASRESISTTQIVCRDPGREDMTRMLLLAIQAHTALNLGKKIPLQNETTFKKTDSAGYQQDLKNTIKALRQEVRPKENEDPKLTAKQKDEVASNTAVIKLKK